MLLSDFGEARIGQGPHGGDIMPLEYQAPETLLYAGWSFPVDIWSVGLTVGVASINSDQLLTVFFKTTRLGTSLSRRNSSLCRMMTGIVMTLKNMCGRSRHVQCSVCKASHIWLKEVSD
jgi:hypothetical protein